MTDTTRAPASAPSTPPSPRSTSVPPAGIPSPPGPGPTTPLPRRLWPVLVALVVVVLILALVGVGIFHSSSPSTAPPSPATPRYSVASGAANRSAAQVGGGPWDFVAAFAVDTPAAVVVPTSTSVGANCTLLPAGSNLPPTNLYVPAFHGTFASGESPWWGMIYAQRAAQEILLVQVLNGTAQALAVGSGACGTAFQNLTTVPSNAVDSSVAASAAWSDGGSAFAAAHSSLSLNMEMILVGNGTFEGVPIEASWVIQITPCGPLGTAGPNGTQPDFQALVNAETGSVTVASATTTVCGSSGVPLGTPITPVLSTGFTTLRLPCVSTNLVGPATVPTRPSSN
jgi:hypothetical protein